MSVAFEWLYARAGGRYPTMIAVGTVLVVSALVVPGYCALLVPIYDLDASTYLRVVLIWNAFLIPGGALGFAVLGLRSLAPVRRWCRGERSLENAAAVWSATVPGLPRAVAAALGCYVIGSCGAVVLVGLELDFPLRGYPIYFGVIIALIGVAGAVAFLCFEQLLRPVLREAVAALPPGSDMPAGTTLSAKALLIVPVISFITAVFVVAAAINDLAPELYLGVGVGTSLLVSLTVASVLARALRTSLVGRVETLRDAMRAVDEGDLDVQVPPLAGDEIDEIGRSFNQMVAGLRERATLREDLQDSRARIVAASDAARRRVERDLHDGAQQHLVLLRLRISEARSAVERDAGAAAMAALTEADQDLQEALDELRRIAHGLYPAALETEGLPGALSSTARRIGTDVSVVCEGVGRYPRGVETAVYFACAEALQNAAKHAGPAARTTVTLSADATTLSFEVADDGAGFAGPGRMSGDGLHNMADRIGAVGGSFEIEASPGAGTRVRGRIPVPPGHPQASGGRSA